MIGLASSLLSLISFYTLALSFSENMSMSPVSWMSLLMKSMALSLSTLAVIELSRLFVAEDQLEGLWLKLETIEPL